MGTPVSGAPLPGIEHIVVLMLENRSFDQILGTLYPPSDSFWGLPLDSSNSAGGTAYTVSNDVPAGAALYTLPAADPLELQPDMHYQIFNTFDIDTQPNMEGFAENYQTVGDPANVMFYFTPGQLPMTNLLANAFAVSDQWFASGPVQTFPNRIFVQCATPGTVDNNGNTAATEDSDWTFEQASNTSIFEVLDGNVGVQNPTANAANWKVYYHDICFSSLVQYVDDVQNGTIPCAGGNPCVASFNDADYTPPIGTTFQTDVTNGTLPTYAFIEPRYFDNVSPSGLPSNSNHPGPSNLDLTSGPPRNMLDGELLLLEVYLALASNNDLFQNTLLIVTYDEHGGIYDHVAPPPATSPFPSPVGLGYVFNTFGVRVPAIFVNPSIGAGTICRPPQPASGDTLVPFDHTTIIATLRAQFGLGGELTPRDGAAPLLNSTNLNMSTTPRPAGTLKPPADVLELLASKPKAAGKRGPAPSREEREELLRRLAVAKGKSVRT